MTSFERRPKGRNNSRRNGRRSYGSRPSHIIKLNDQGRSFNSQRTKFNGSASKLHEKYKKLALESLSTGDKILAESYFQHADHFARMLPSQDESNNTNRTDKVSGENGLVSSEEELSEIENNDTKEQSSDGSNVVAKSVQDN
tara:strand:- start:1317 stop:1742 length:426 start_codon:yes stop_codon:yes gene_type:complete